MSTNFFLSTGGPSLTESGVAYPSGFTPPAVPNGMTQLLFDDFLGTSLNTSLWDPYSGAPGGTTGWWRPDHITVGSYGSTSTPSVCNLNMYYDPSGSGTNNWVGGGMGADGTEIVVGSEAYVAMRLDPYAAGGLVGIALLIGWLSNWPPEIDFFETYAWGSGPVGNGPATLHWGAANSQVTDSFTGVDLTIWHVWGVKWGTTTISYTLDGTVWASRTNPDQSTSDSHSLVQPQVLSLQIQTGDSSVGYPPQDTSITAANPIKMQIDWASVFSP